MKKKPDRQAQKPYDVFVSYSSKDQEIADRLVQILENCGIRCWIASRDIPDGGIWAVEIDRAIQASRAFVLLLSKNSLASKQVYKELNLADKPCENKYPIRIDNAPLSEGFNYHLSGLQIKKAIQDPEINIQELAKTIQADLDIKPPLPQPPKTVEAITSPPEPALGDPSPAEPKIPAEKELRRPKPPSAERRPSNPDRTANARAFPNKLLLTLLVVVSCLIGFFLFLITLYAGKRFAETLVKRTPTASDVQAAADPGPTPSEGSSPLFGVWCLDHAVGDGDTPDCLYPTAFFVRSDGGVYLSDYSKDYYFNISTSHGVLPKIVINDHSLNFIDACPPTSNPDAYTISTTCFFLDSLEEITFLIDENSIEKLSLEVPQSITTRPEEISLSHISYKTCYPELWLVIHMTGSYRESPVNVKPIDLWIFYEREREPFFPDTLPTLVGNWTDSMGNAWHFMPDTKEKEISYTLTTPEGSVYENASPISCLWEEARTNNRLERVSFTFFGFSMNNYSIVYYDGNLLYMLDENNAPFWLTRDGAFD